MSLDFVGISDNIAKIRELIDDVAHTGLNVVVSGETGVGKEVVVRNLYQKSPRARNPFVKINCAALPEGLLESELYGYEQGAFTGAERKRRGKFELSHKGVLFLDEIGDMSVTLQSKLLHVLQNGEFAPLGSEKDIKTDTWVIAATNHNLEQDVKEGRFREDLYYRLQIIRINISPLRERPEDIPPLIDYYWEKYVSQLSGEHPVKPSRPITEKLVSYYWPGNVRQLQNVLKNVLVAGKWEEVIDDLFSQDLFSDASNLIRPSFQAPSIISDFIELREGDASNLASISLKKIKKKAVDRVEKEIISYVLDQTHWNRTKASKILKISYKTLLYKIDDLEIVSPSK
jgi:transcriptional regulator with PAS, ATPase and Fis domain